MDMKSYVLMRNDIVYCQNLFAIVLEHESYELSRGRRKNSIFNSSTYWSLAKATEWLLMVGY